MQYDKHLLEKLLSNFNAEARHLVNFTLRVGDGNGSLAYLAARAFEGNAAAYEQWLLSGQSDLGTLKPIELLGPGSVNGSWVVRKALLERCLRRQEVFIDSPPSSVPKYKKVTVGGFTQWQLVASGNPPASA